jgi:hypothetical protein
VAGVGKDKLFLKDVLREFNDTSVASKQYGVLALTLESDVTLFMEKGVDPSQPDNTKTWSDLHSMYLLIIKD